MHEPPLFARSAGSPVSNPAACGCGVLLHVGLVGTGGKSVQRKGIHVAILIESEVDPHPRAGHLHRELRRGVDENKDQTYFLWGIDRSVLSRMILPVGDSTKEEIRATARQLRLSVVADKPESQEICFVPDGNYSGFIDRYLEAEGAADRCRHGTALQAPTPPLLGAGPVGAQVLEPLGVVEGRVGEHLGAVVRQRLLEHLGLVTQ